MGFLQRTADRWPMELGALGIGHHDLTRPGVISRPVILHYTHAVRGVKGSGQCRESTFHGKSSEGKRGVLVKTSPWIYIFLFSRKPEEEIKQVRSIFFMSALCLHSATVPLRSIDVLEKSTGHSTPLVQYLAQIFHCSSSGRRVHI